MKALKANVQFTLIFQLPQTSNAPGGNNPLSTIMLLNIVWNKTQGWPGMVTYCNQEINFIILGHWDLGMSLQTRILSQNPIKKMKIGSRLLIINNEYWVGGVCGGNQYLLNWEMIVNLECPTLPNNHGQNEHIFRHERTQKLYLIYSFFSCSLEMCSVKQKWFRVIFIVEDHDNGDDWNDDWGIRNTLRTIVGSS